MPGKLCRGGRSRSISSPPPFRSARNFSASQKQDAGGAAFLAWFCSASWWALVFEMEPPARRPHQLFRFVTGIPWRMTGHAFERKVFSRLRADIESPKPPTWLTRHHNECFFSCAPKTPAFSNSTSPSPLRMRSPPIKASYDSFGGIRNHMVYGTLRRNYRVS